MNTPEGAHIVEEKPTTDSLKGLPTMSAQRTTGAGLSNIWLLKAIFYDRFGHTIQVQSNNQLKYTAAVLTDATTTVSDFTGKPLVSKTVKVIYSSGTTTHTDSVKTVLAYDGTNSRVIDIDQQYNNQTGVRIASYTYNELGQLILKNLAFNGTKYLQTEDFRFNIRGQLTTINNSTLNGDGGVTNNDSNDLFGMQILYDQTDSNLGAHEKAYYSGRINAVKWMTRNSSDVKVHERSYVYGYDRLDRYTGSYYAERDTNGGNGIPAFLINEHGFDENAIAYDENGNITAMQRNSIISGTVSQVDKPVCGQ